MFDNVALVLAAVSSVSTLLAGGASSGLVEKIAERFGLLAASHIKKSWEQSTLDGRTTVVLSQPTQGRLQATDAMPPELIQPGDRERPRCEAARRHLLSRLRESRAERARNRGVGQCSVASRRIPWCLASTSLAVQ